MTHGVYDLGSGQPTDIEPGSAIAVPADQTDSQLGELMRQWSLDALNVVGTMPTERFDRITRLARHIFGTDRAAITFIDHDRQWYKSETGGLSGTEIARDDSFCTHTIEQPQSMVVPDALTDPRFSAKPSVESGEIRFYAGHPLLGPGGERVGALCVFGAEPKEFTEADHHMLRDLAHWVQDELVVETEQLQGVQVQQGMLPTPLASLAGYQVAGACRPVRAMSGDFYDWYPVAGGVAVTMGGVMSRGVAAALMAATVRATMRASSRFDGVAAAVEGAAETMDADLDGAGVFVTLFHGHLDEESGVLHYIDAGHGLSIVVRAGGSSEHLEPTGLPIGAGWENTQEERTVALRPGDLFVSVSDGVLDAFGGTLQALDRVATFARSAGSAAAVVDAIVEAAAGTASDDLTVIALRRDEVLRLER